MDSRRTCKGLEIKTNDCFRNNKTGEIYRIMNVAIECTNSRAGETTIIYNSIDTINLVFTRERGEFLEKFTLVEVGLYD